MLSRIINILIAFVFSSHFLSAQELIVKDFAHLQNDLSARAVKTKRVDTNGNLCALVKVEFAAPESKFDGYVIGDVVNENSTYWVYMCGKNPASRHMTIAVDRFLPLNVYFADYGVNVLQDGETYKLTIALPEGYSVTQSRKTPHHLSLACEKEGERFFFMPEDWDKLSDKERADYHILGITVVDSGQELVLALNDASDEPVDWGHPMVEIETLKHYEKAVDDFDGNTNTSKMIGDALKWGIRYPAATLARDYRAYPQDKTIWYLPSAGEMNIIAKYMEDITPLLEKYGGKGFTNVESDGSWNYVGHWRWTSTLNDNEYAYTLSGSNFTGGSFNRMKYIDKNRVRPITKASTSIKDTSDKWKEMLTVLYYSKKRNDYFYQTDITLSNMIDEDKEKDIMPVGIVLTNGEHSFIIAVDDAIEDKVEWGPAIDIPELPNITKERDVYADMDGLSNTEIIKAYSKSSNIIFPPVKAVESYKPFEQDRIHWYLPSSGELLLVNDYKNYINDILSMLNKPKLSDWYWPSTEENKKIVWLIPADYGYLDDQPKLETKAHVRAAASLRLLK